MARRVILHVGAPKTGTSYLETILWSQVKQLEADGVWMPGRSRKDHDALMGEVRGGVWRHQDPAWTWAKVGRAARERTETVLVSKEMLSGASAEQVRVALDPLDGQEVHVVVTARQLAGALPSAWQQLVKARHKLRFADWLEAVHSDPDHGFWRHHDPTSILRRWAVGLPEAQVHVIPVPAGGDPVELWRRFAGVIGVEPTSYETPRRPRNESLGATQIEVLRRVNVALGSDLPMRLPYQKHVHDRLTHAVLRELGNGGQRFGVGAAHADWLTDRAAQIVHDLEGMPCRVVGDLADLTPRIDPELCSPDEVDTEEVAALATQALARLLVDVARG